MTIVRAILRRGMTQRPSAIKLVKEFELEWLATELAKHENKFGRHFYEHRDRGDPRKDDSWETFKVLPVRMPGEKAAPTTQERVAVTRLLEIFQKSVQKPAQELVDIRQHVGQLCQWIGPASDAAISAANAVEAVLNTLFPPESEQMQKFDWYLDVNFCPGDMSPGRSVYSGYQRLFLTARVDKRGNRKYWQTDVGKIEALLSLWLRHAHSSAGGKKTDRKRDNRNPNWLRNKPRKQNMLFLGPDSLHLRRDLRWWVPGGVAGLLEVRRGPDDQKTSPDDQKTSPDDQKTSRDAEPNSYRIDSDRITGFYGPLSSRHDFDSSNNGTRVISFRCDVVPLDDAWSDKPDLHQEPQTSGCGREHSPSDNLDGTDVTTLLGIVTTTPKEQLFAQHIFRAFMMTAAKKLDRIGGKSEASPETANNRPTSWQHIRVQNTMVANMALGIQNAGLAKSLEEAYLCIIPSLSLQYKLPVGAAVDLVLRNVEQYECVLNWKKSTGIYLELLRVAKFGSASCPFALKAAVAVVEYLNRIANHKNLYSKEDPDLETMERHVESVRKRWTDLVSDEVKASICLLYQRQHRLRHYANLLNYADDSKAKKNLMGVDRGLSRKIGLRGPGERDMNDKTSSDSWTFGRRRTADGLTNLYNPDAKKDPMAEHHGFSELHKKVSANEPWKPEEGKRYMNEQDIVGWSPLHYAINQDYNCVE